MNLRQVLDLHDIGMPENPKGSNLAANSNFRKNTEAFSMPVRHILLRFAVFRLVPGFPPFPETAQN
jgi:hypothetical protein